MLGKFDWLTDPVTLYYNGGLQHTSIASVVTSIIGYVSSVIIGLYLSVDFFKRKNPTVFYFNRYVEDSGIYPFNSDSIFHLFRFVTTTNTRDEEIDPTYIRVIGTQSSIQEYLDLNHSIAAHDHWIYGLCDNGTDIKGIEFLYDYDIFHLSYCIKKYFNHEEDKYYTTSDDNFIYPSTKHGTSHPNKTFYGLVFERCNDKDRIGKEMLGDKKCRSDSEIDDYMTSHYLRFYMIDHYPDVYNYKTPFSKYLYNIDTTLSSGSYTYNHINFNPSKIVSNIGYFFDETVTEQAYMFDQNSQENGAFGGAYVAFYFWLKNQMAIYDRTYKRIQDVLAEVEAMIDLIIFIASIINNYISEYVTLRDTVHVLFTLKSKKINRSQITRILQTKRRTMFEKDNPPRRNNMQYNNYYYNSNKNDENSDRLGMNNNTNNNNQQRIGNYRPNRREQILYQRNIENNKNNYNNNNNVRFNNKNSGYSGYSGYSNIKGNMLKDKNNPMDIDIYNKIKIETPKEEEKVNKIEDDDIPGFDPFKETKLKLSDFTHNYFLFCKKKEDTIDAYENFRMKIISEENLIQNYLDIHIINKTLQQMNKDESGDNH